MNFKEAKRNITIIPIKIYLKIDFIVRKRARATFQQSLVVPILFALA